MKRPSLERLPGEVAARLITDGRSEEVLIALNDARRILGLTPDQMLGHLRAGTLQARGSLKPGGGVYITADEIIRFIAAYGWKPYSERN